MSWLNKYPDGGKLKPKPKVSLDDLRPKGLGVQAQDNTRRLPLVDPKIAYNKSWDEYIANQPQVSQARVQSIPQQQANLLKKKDYVYTHPNAKLVDGEIERKNIYRNTEGVPDKGTPAAKQDRFLNDSFEALNAASIIMPAGELLGAGAKAAGRYLTEQTALKNAYKLNPLAFKPNPEAYYRMVGKEGYKDALESGVVRANPNNIHPWDGTQIYNEPYFSKGIPLDRDWKSPLSKKIGSIYKGPNMVEVNDASKFKASDSFVSSPNSELSSFDPYVKFYKEDWLKGYKEIPKPKDINNTYWNGRAYQQGPTSTQEVLSTSSGMDAVNAVKPGYNSQYFVKQGYVPPTTDPRLMATLSEETVQVGANNVGRGNISNVTSGANPSTQTGAFNIGPDEQHRRMFDVFLLDKEAEKNIADETIKRYGIGHQAIRELENSNLGVKRTPTPFDNVPKAPQSAYNDFKTSDWYGKNNIIKKYNPYNEYGYGFHDDEQLHQMFLNSIEDHSNSREAFQKSLPKNKYGGTLNNWLNKY